MNYNSGKLQAGEVFSHPALLVEALEEAGLAAGLREKVDRLTKDVEGRHGMEKWKDLFLRAAGVAGPPEDPLLDPGLSLLNDVAQYAAKQSFESYHRFEADLNYQGMIRSRAYSDLFESEVERYQAQHPEEQHLARVFAAVSERNPDFTEKYEATRIPELVLQAIRALICRNNPDFTQRLKDKAESRGAHFELTNADFIIESRVHLFSEPPGPLPEYPFWTALKRTIADHHRPQ